MRANDTDTRCTERERFLWMENTLKTLLQQTDAYNRANEAVLEAQHASRMETTLLRAEIETLTRTLKDYTATTPPT
jgi:regulator of replication initiation timing